MFTNEYEIDMYLNRFMQADTPNLRRGAVVLYRLAQWTNDNSDGWAYWKVPQRASVKLQSLLYANREGREDVTRELLKARLTPIKAMLTRQGVDPDVKAWILAEGQ